MDHQISHLVVIFAITNLLAKACTQFISAGCNYNHVSWNLEFIHSQLNRLSEDIAHLQGGMIKCIRRKVLVCHHFAVAISVDNRGHVVEVQNTLTIYATSV